MKSLLAAALAQVLSLTITASPRGADAGPPRELLLDNGMRVMLIPRPGAGGAVACGWAARVPTTSGVLRLETVPAVAIASWARAEAQRLAAPHRAPVGAQLEAVFWLTSAYSRAAPALAGDVTAVLAGDFDASAVESIMRSAFAAVPAGTSADAPAPLAYLPHSAEVRLLVNDDRAPSRVAVRYYTVPAGHPDEPALHVLGAMIEARMRASLAGEGGVAAGVSALQIGLGRAGFFAFSAAARESAPPEDLLAAWDGTIVRLTVAPPDATEINAARAILRGDTNERHALDALRGDRGAADRLDSVTPADVLRVAQAHFAPSRRCVALVHGRAPEPIGDAIAALPPEQRARFEALLGQFLTRDDPDALQEGLTLLESVRDRFSGDLQAPYEEVLEKIRVRIAELRGR
jgi:hypothetical protein